MCLTTRSALASSLLVVLLTACSSSKDSTSAGPSVSPKDVAAACAHYAQVSCAKRSSCSPYHAPFFFPNDATCLASEAAYCREPFERAGTNASIEWLAGCTAAIETTVCTRSWYFEPDACDPVPGTFADGDECVDSDQCASGHCAFLDGLCGECLARPKTLELGAVCGDTGSDCKDGLLCLGGVCVLYPGLGEACSPSEQLCDGGLACTQGACAATQAEGGVCDGDAGCQFGFDCENGVCVSSPPAITLGKPCVAGSIDLSERCLGSEYCAASGYGEPGVCKAQLNEGEACVSVPLVDPCFVTFACIAGVCSSVPPLSACLP